LLATIGIRLDRQALPQRDVPAVGQAPRLEVGLWCASRLATSLKRFWPIVEFHRGKLSRSVTLPETPRRPQVLSQTPFGFRASENRANRLTSAARRIN
jgi:hypothetical protein